MSSIKSISVHAVPLDEGTQMRVTVSAEVVAEYAAAMKDGATFPPIIVFEEPPDDDGNTPLHLGDGFHRLKGAIEAGRTMIEADVRVGTRRDAVLFSLGANALHGLARSNDDKRKAVVFALRDPELRVLSQREIARLCGCTQAAVSKINAEINPKPKKQKGEAAADNGYQPPVFDTPQQVVAALMDAEERRTVFALLVQRSSSMSGEPKQAKLLERLGLATTYGEQYQKTVEWTPMADQVLVELLGADEWAAFEVELFKLKSGYSSAKFGKVKALLEKLVEAGGWVGSRDIGYEWDGWLQMLVKHGEVAEHVVAIGEYDKRHYYHIAAPGCARLKLGYSLIIRDAPAKEQIEAEDKEKKRVAKEQQDRELAERLARLDPAKEADRERKELLDGWSTSVISLRKRLARQEWLDVTEVQPALDVLYQAIQAAGVKASKLKKVEKAQAAVAAETPVEPEPVVEQAAEVPPAVVSGLPTAQPLTPERAWELELATSEREALEAARSLWRDGVSSSGWFIESGLIKWGYGTLKVQHLAGRGLLEKMQLDQVNGSPLTHYRISQDGVNALDYGPIQPAATLAESGISTESPARVTDENWPAHWLPFEFEIGQHVKLAVSGVEQVVEKRNHNGSGERFYQLVGLKYRHFSEKELVAAEPVAVVEGGHV